MIWTKFMGLNSSHPDEVVGFSRPSKVTRLNKSSSRRLEAGLPLDAVDTRRNAGVIANDLWPKGEETMGGQHCYAATYAATCRFETVLRSQPSCRGNTNNMLLQTARINSPEDMIYFHLFS